MREGILITFHLSKIAHVHHAVTARQHVQLQLLVNKIVHILDSASNADAPLGMSYIVFVAAATCAEEPFYRYRTHFFCCSAAAARRGCCWR
jgi:hypothetical protein